MPPSQKQSRSEVSHLEQADAENQSPSTVHGFAAVADQLPKGYYTSSYFLGSCFAVGMSAASAWGGFGFIGPILGQIDADLGPSPNILWVALVYTLGTGVGLLLVGRITDLFGRRWFFIGGSALGLIGAIVAATATSVNTLIGGETLIALGASAGLSYPLTLGEMVPMKYRFVANGLIYIFAFGTSGMGAAVSTALILHTGPQWRWCYYILIICNGLAALSWFAFYHPPTFHMKWGRQSRTKVVKDFDYIGLVLFMAGLILFLIGLTWGGTAYPWRSAHVISTIIIGFLCLVALAVWETFGSPREPLLPMYLFKNRGYVAAVLLVSLGATVYYAFAIIWPAMVATVYGDGRPMWVGWISSLVGIGITVGELIGGIFAEKIGKVKYQCITMITLGSIFLAAAAVCTPTTQSTAIALVSLCSFCIGWNEAIALGLTAICVDNQQDIGVATGFGGSARSTISTIGSTIYQVVLQARLKTTIPRRVAPAVTSAGLPTTLVPAFITALTAATPQAFASIQGITPEIIAAGTEAYKYAHSDAYRTVFLTSIAISALAMTSSLFITNVDNLMTLEVAATLHTRGKGGMVGTSETVLQGDGASTEK